MLGLFALHNVIIFPFSPSEEVSNDIVLGLCTFPIIKNLLISRSVQPPVAKIKIVIQTYRTYWAVLYMGGNRRLAELG